MYLHSEVLLSFKKEGGTDTWYNTWKSLENIMLNKRNQTKKATYYILLYAISRILKSVETESRLVVLPGALVTSLWSY